MTTTPTMAGKICLVTGGTAGIGFVTARELARAGAEVTIVGRDGARGAAAAAAIGAAAGGAPVDFIAADLGEQEQVRSFASRFGERHDRLDVLVNNAGGLFGRRQTTGDGIERTFALNHLGYFLTTMRLLPLLQAAAPARIVVVASEAHRGARLDFDDLQGEQRYSRWTAYKRSKLANLLFCYELARRLTGRGITANALHPGFVATEIGTRHRFVPSLLWRIGTAMAAISPEDGARTSVYLASALDVAAVSGSYFIKSTPARSSDASYNRASAERLWDISLNLTATADI